MILAKFRETLALTNGGERSGIEERFTPNAGFPHLHPYIMGVTRQSECTRREEYPKSFHRPGIARALFFIKKLG